MRDVCVPVVELEGLVSTSSTGLLLCSMLFLGSWLLSMMCVILMGSVMYECKCRVVLVKKGCMMKKVGFPKGVG